MTSNRRPAAFPAGRRPVAPTSSLAVLDRADVYKADRNGFRPLAGKSVAVVFEKNSTRTRLSFEVGIAQLGGQPVIVDGRTSQLGREETIEDTSRVLSRFVDAVAIRTFAQRRINALAERVDGAGDQRADRRVPPLPGARRPADHPGAQGQARRSDPDLPRRRRQQHGALADGRRRERRYGGAGLVPARLRPARRHPARRQEAGRRDGRVDRAGRRSAMPRSTVPTFWSPTPGPPWVRRTTGSTGSAPSGRTRSMRACSAVPRTDAIVLHCLPAHRGWEITDDVHRRAGLGGLGRGGEPVARAEGAAGLPSSNSPESCRRQRSPGAARR